MTPTPQVKPPPFLPPSHRLTPFPLPPSSARLVVPQESKGYADVSLSHMYVDNAAMQLIRWPKQFDTIVCGNLFGDILSDEVQTTHPLEREKESSTLGLGFRIRLCYLVRTRFIHIRIARRPSCSLVPHASL